MSETPYTENDLRTEAARQHAELTEDPDFTGTGERMSDSPAHADGRSDTTWSRLLDPEGDYSDAYSEAQQKVHDLITGAADVSEWAVNLGADGLEPDDHALDAGKNRVRVHFAFAPDISDADRADIVDQFAKFMTTDLS